MKVTQKLRREGWDVLGGMQNRSGHGVDIVARRLDGAGRMKYLVAEVKANSGRLSKAQKELGGAAFAKSRFNRSANWNNLSKRAKDARSALEQAYKSEASIEYLLYKVDLTGNRAVIAPPINW